LWGGRITENRGIPAALWFGKCTLKNAGCYATNLPQKPDFLLATKEDAQAVISMQFIPQSERSALTQG
jgi:hypothetical protein